jgi:uncharacterized protein (DUF427 family)
MKAIWNNKVIAQSEKTVVVESNHYFPFDSLKGDYFVGSETTSFCPWKGTAHYFSIEVDGKTNTDAAWYYPTPKEKAKNIAGMVAFWRGVQVTD